MASKSIPKSALKQSPLHANFTIGWICILQKEYRAALAILDEIYDNIPLARGEGDRNLYVLGRVGKHYIVINVPPSDWNGRIRASTIAHNMRSSFPRMRFVLMVGIAGGAPSPKEDVRLGDVVLGTQVIPWNTGKWTQHGFERTGLTKVPPRELLEAITFLDQRFWSSDELLLSKAIEDIASKAPNGVAFIRPIKDRLYQPGFPHTESTCDCLQTESGLPGQLCLRSQRNGDSVRIFQGAIGSPNAFTGSETEKLRQARDTLIERRDFFREIIIPEIRQKQRIFRDDSPELRDEIQRLKDSQKVLKGHLQDINDILKDHDYLDSSPDPAVREEYRDLRTQLEKDLQAIESLASIAGGTLKNTGDMLMNLAGICKHNGMKVAGVVLVAISTFLGRTMKLWRSSKLSPEAMLEWIRSKVGMMRGSGNVNGHIQLV
ncbi:uncharacterized protein N7496_008768 [Penicillium cataractarum]|uniref:Nucleoside phosphorylase domain-containing protein n=1 Tax=Penicillium cataractarum TaxID=2100454 RepID=A0A9W9V4V1_9EURO|nr:uncharacterized protein N7496_008768 [Penicillium cataractarum]KAJ5369008.1 hypothetical protein N7496_008768 [Penicillium cataractarum]